jgi:hypothetical protein
MNLLPKTSPTTIQVDHDLECRITAAIVAISDETSHLSRELQFQVHLGDLDGVDKLSKRIMPLAGAINTLREIQSRIAQ